MIINKKVFLWSSWAVSVVALSGYLGLALQNENEDVFLPDETTHGHYQIEMACSACHTDNFEGVKQDACLQCHKEELDRVEDSHPAKKFVDPRNAERIEQLDARYCITCHREHQPEITQPMGVTLPMDYCAFCHQDIAEDRPSHAGMGFDTCATAGCHNYHDNSALYEDFLVKHADGAPFLVDPVVRESTTYKTDLTPEELKARILELTQLNAPNDKANNTSINHEWASTIHAQAGVNCTDCHNVEDSETGIVAWVDSPNHESCQKCHEHETKGFLEGRHGMRLAQGLSPMQPSMARLTDFHHKSMHQNLDCTSCHGAHDFDTQHAAVNACMNCHDDEHTRNYLGSKHYALWLNEVNGDGEKGSGVSCATCHMPKMKKTVFDEEIVYVEHNQNASLRPNEKMIRPACMECHGLGFAIDSLADPELIRKNFQGMPSKHIESIDMAKERE